jgi:hypothetical protein
MKKFLLLFVAIFSYAYIDFYSYVLKFNYKEYFSGVVIDRDYSKNFDILGVGINYFSEGIFDYYLKGEFARGDSFYDGMNSSGEKIQTKQNGFYLANMEFGIGKYLYFFGGYRVWNRGKSEFNGDYDEIYYWSYIGFKYKCRFDFNIFYFSPEAGYTLAIDPKMKVKMGNQPLIELGETTGGFIEAPIYLKVDENFDIKIFYKLIYWHINQSKMYTLIIDDKTYPIFEPESLTINQYFGIGISYKF